MDQEVFEPRKCKFCRKIFIPHTRDQYYCDKKCRKDMEKKRYRENAAKETEKRRKVEESRSIISEDARKAHEMGMSYGKYKLWLEQQRRKK